ncbi:glycolipid transfer protein-like [Hydractinia symbiolongicarpus]|uniref:glycolipid transfer protein-like n=1 Tax=Hydractinia symbiolongicarpus TaxID=13093 RepID=UPI00254BAEDD|nr:glycolipid transfer protein-like [Hydractinia symbiolongicarpus]
MSTFFKKTKHSYQPIPEDGKIVTQSFLDACSEIVPFFDVLGSTAFAPVKSDINGNIAKLRKKLATNPEKFVTLQDIVNSEIEEKSTKAKNSATDALLWLKRALTFIRTFLEDVLTGEQDLTKCAKKAYEQSLKKYHGWMVQGIFSLAMKAVPYRKDFIKALGPETTEEEVLADMKEVVEMMALNIDNINAFYVQTGQESDQKV